MRVDSSSTASHGVSGYTHALSEPLSVSMRYIKPSCGIPVELMSTLRAGWAQVQGRPRGSLDCRLAFFSSSLSRITRVYLGVTVRTELTISFPRNYPLFTPQSDHIHT